MTEAFKQGYMDKLAEFAKSAGPRPAERDVIKRLAQNIVDNPELLKKFVVDGKAPARGDDPVWNPGNVQKWVTGASLAPVLAAPAVRAGAGFLKNIYSSPNMDPVGGAALPIAGILGAGQYWDRFKFLREMSDLQRRRDADAISSGTGTDKFPVWTHVDYLRHNGMESFSDKKVLDQAVSNMDFHRQYPGGKYVAKTQEELNNYNKWFPGRGVLAGSTLPAPQPKAEATSGSGTK